MKKKLLFMFVLILAVISIQIAVLADMDAPSIKPYNATVSNVEGARLYDFIENGTSNSTFEDVGSLKYGDSIKIVYEVDVEGELYGIYHVKGEHEGPTLYIKINDIKAIEETPVEPSEDALKNSKKAIVLVDDVEIYEGPAYGYNKKEIVLTKGTEIELYNDQVKAGNPWYFVKTNDASGWVCILNGAVGIKNADAEYFEKNKEIMTSKELKVYKDTTYSEVVGTIPVNTKIEDFWDIDDWSWGLYIEYNNISGYVQSDDYATNMPWIKEESIEYIANYPAKIYKEADLRSEVLVEEVPLETKLKATYAVNTQATTWIYVNYNDISGWLFDVNELLSEGETYQDVLDRELEYYKLEEENFKNENLNNENLDNESNSTEEFKEETASTEEMQKDVIVGQTNEDVLYTVSGMQIVLICVAFAIVLALTVLVTIILVNKNNKKPETKAEDKKEN